MQNQNQVSRTRQLFVFRGALSSFFLRLTGGSRLQNSHFWMFSEGAKCCKRDLCVWSPQASYAGVWGEKTTIGFSYNKFVLSRVSYNVIEVTDLLESSTHILQQLSMTSNISVQTKLKFRWTSIISALLPTVCKILPENVKPWSGPLAKTIIFRYVRLVH